MKYIKTIVVVLACVAQTALLCAQDHDHSHLRNEIGFSGGAIYSPNHEAWGGTMHLHYFRSLGVHSKWALGGGVEQAWADGSHFTVGAGVKYMVIDRLNIGLMPGVTFFKHNDHDTGSGEEAYESRFSLHFELVYDLLHWEKFHLGPAFDFSWSGDDSHLMLGIHAAYCF